MPRRTPPADKTLAATSAAPRLTKTKHTRRVSGRGRVFTGADSCVQETEHERATP